MVSVNTAYISTGGNRYSAAADWDRQSGIHAYGSDQNIALSKPLVRPALAPDSLYLIQTQVEKNGIRATLVGHTDTVTAVKFLQSTSVDQRILLTASADCVLRVWQIDSETFGWTAATTVKAHWSSINAVAVAPGKDIFATAAADATVKVWRLDTTPTGDLCLLLVTTITLKPRYIPLAVSLRCVHEETSRESLLLAVSGTTSIIQIYAVPTLREGSKASLQASLSGHEGWVRSVDLRSGLTLEDGGLLLASASQDKYVRLWRFHKGGIKGSVASESSQALGAPTQSTLTAKLQTVEVAGIKFTITFEALLLGHEDWVYTATWNPARDRQQLLTASADNSLSIWEPDPDSGIWVSTARLGEISGQKGSTSATGSTGGFWTGLWSPDGNAVCCLGRTGSWRLWQFDLRELYWIPQIGIGGHVGTVSDLVWEKHSQYLLSTSSDQTTRLHARCENTAEKSWHEFSRPQIHGYDLNCIASIRPDTFVSGADEKLLRVFQEPNAIADLLHRLCNIPPPSASELPDTAGIPVLGLSNKAGEDAGGEEGTVNGTSGPDDAVDVNELLPNRPRIDISRPPLEDNLAKGTLWPEQEKLYGHGYEISAVATSHDGTLIASACKSSSLSHAVIKLYDTSDWHEIRPSLEAHSSTALRLRFSTDDQFLLSVGRDRQWAIFKRTAPGDKSYTLLASNPKGHTRMILDAAWVNTSKPRAFVTAGRDKSVKIWVEEGNSYACKTTIQCRFPVTAVDSTTIWMEDAFCIAVGEEDGQIRLHTVSFDTWDVRLSTLIEKMISPSKAITRLAWRPELRDGVSELAVASHDSSVRVFSISARSAT
ncbi:MAG: hypothetical protein Q9227_006345 [Pyrenula ochraceoflavens]